MSELTDKVFQAVIVNVFKGLKETMRKEVKEGVMAVCHPIEIINRGAGIIKKNQRETLKLRNIITKMQYSL